MLVQITPQTFNASAFTATGKGRAHIHCPAPEIALAPFANRTITLDHEAEPRAESIEACVATSAALVFTMPGQHFAQSQFAEILLVAGQLGNFRRRRRDLFA